MQEDIDLGKKIAAESPRLGLSAFRDVVYHQIDLNRFDYDGGEPELLQAVILTTVAYQLAGGVIEVPPQESE